MKFSSNISFLLIGFAAAGIILTAYVFFVIYRKFDPYLDRDLSGPVLLDNKWSEIKMPVPLKPEREIQLMCFDYAERYLPDYKTWSVKLSDGTPVKIEIHMIDEYGNTFEFDKTNGLSDKTICFCRKGPDGLCLIEDALPRDREYQAVKFRSSLPLKMSKVFWRSYNIADRK